MSQNHDRNNRHSFARDLSPVVDEPVFSRSVLQFGPQRHRPRLRGLEKLPAHDARHLAGAVRRVCSTEKKTTHLSLAGITGETVHNLNGCSVGGGIAGFPSDPRLGLVHAASREARHRGDNSLTWLPLDEVHYAGCSAACQRVAFRLFANGHSLAMDAVRQVDNSGKRRPVDEHDNDAAAWLARIDWLARGDDDEVARRVAQFDGSVSDEQPQADVSRVRWVHDVSKRKTGQQCHPVPDQRCCRRWPVISVATPRDAAGSPLPEARFRPREPCRQQHLLSQESRRQSAVTCLR